MKELIAYVKKNSLETTLRYDAEAAPQDRWGCDIFLPPDTIVQGHGRTAKAAIRKALENAGQDLSKETECSPS